MVKRSDPYWFPAKPSGLGWGLPITWQGWLFFSTWLAFVLGVPPFLKDRMESSLMFIGGMVAVLFLVLYFKGEPINRPPREPQ
jgi:hypothetical protein